eukprot:76015_1
MSTSLLNGLISVNPSNRLNRLHQLYHQLNARYGDWKARLDNHDYPIHNNYAISTTNALVKSLQISTKKTRNKQYHKIKGEIIFKIFQCLFYFIDSKPCMALIENNNLIEFILNLVDEYILSKYFPMQQKQTNKLKNILNRQLLLTSFVRKIVIFANSE